MDVEEAAQRLGGNFEPTPELLARIWARDPEHPRAANPADYKGDATVAETALRGRRMNIYHYRGAGR